MQNLQEYKCPCCSGAIAFDSTLQKMKCPFCDTEFEMEALKGYDAELQNEKKDNMEWENNAGGDWQEGETDGLRSYVCKSCGGEIVGDANTAATACPFCNNPVVMMNQFSGALKPDLVIPFKLDKKAAKAGLVKHLTGKRLLPKVFKDQNHIDEIKGIYVPFWLFDTDVDAQIRYRASKVRTWSDKDYNYTETSYYMVHRGGSIGFEHVPVDGSSKMADDLMEWENNAGGDWQEGETDGLRSYVCKSCGGEIVGDANTAATACPFCNNPVVMMNQFSGALKPDLVIPFKLDKKAAKAGLVKHLTGKRLLPKVFKDQNHIDEIKGIYVPFWLFDTDVDAQIRYRASKVRTWSDKDYNYTETSYYMVHRGGSIGFEHVPVDGSSKMADDLMESIEPYDFSEAVDFQTAYLAGYLADKYDVTAEASIDRANKRVKRSTEDSFAGTVQGYATVRTEYSSVQFRGGKASYALYPVWLLNTTWNGNKYTFAMNGQTGKFVGDLPVDKAAARRWTFLMVVIYSAAVYGVVWLLHLIGLF